MEPFPSYPVGARVPDTPHAVCCSLPTLRDVIGYEEHDPDVRAHVKSGYPRFVEHEYIRQLTDHVRRDLKLENRGLALAPSHAAAGELAAFLAPAETSLHEWGPLTAVAFPPDDDLQAKARRFFQHTGRGLSSSEAEDLLHQAGEISERTSEPEQPHPGTTIRDALADACPEADPAAFLLSRSGMNAFYSAFKAARKLQRPRGKTVWIQLGWLYLDTIRILENFLAPDERCIVINDARDTRALETVFSREGDRIAGIVTETPTNPLLQTADLARIRELCDRTGALLFVDPTLTSFYNVNVFPYADVVTHSLTKYFAHRADVMMGFAAFNPQRNPFADEWLHLAQAENSPPYHRDLQRLAGQIGDTRTIVETVNRNTMAVAAFLEQHPRVKKLHWAYGPDTAAGYEKLARGPNRPGGILTLELDMPLAEFYDAAPFVKGPSFGTAFTMMCPFMYLAHYDLVSNPSGRKYLLERGIDPDLVRVSIGAEDPERIKEGFRRALG